MSAYNAPVEDMFFALTKLANIDNISKLSNNTDISSDSVKLLIEEAGKFAKEKLDSINSEGDDKGIKLENGLVRMPNSFISSYKSFIESGWFSIAGKKQFGGQDFPWSVLVCINEIWESANMSFAVNNMLTQGAIELIQEHGNESQKNLYLPNLISGKYSGTMNLTEPHAGSDLSDLKTKATIKNDKYTIKGTKIYITHGDQDMSENIIHMVLARLPDAPEGNRGISLFLVPKYYDDENGNKIKNDIKVVSIEHKLGHNASPTCVLSFGENNECIGELIGEPNCGLKAMFTMMNNARLNVGVQGVAISERSYQRALSFARDRKQGFSFKKGKKERVNIIEHPDVKRMLLEMKSQIEAMRGLTVFTAETIDYSNKLSNTEEGVEYLNLSSLLTPIVKAWCTDQSVFITSLGIQVHGGMGFIEDTGAAQYFRDSRILPIYEGTNGIQALDLLKRKLSLDGGKTFKKLLEKMKKTAFDCKNANLKELSTMGGLLEESITSLESSASWLTEELNKNPDNSAAGATPFLNMFGWILGGWVMCKASLTIEKNSLNKELGNQFCNEKINTSLFFCTTYLPTASALMSTIKHSHKSLSVIC
ncbi:MAG: acyl-CoA dehydrogenase [Pelagibacterales bacterium]|nr:acyl-CoA dehydrogenase [Pelagibacterales bacterium]